MRMDAETVLAEWSDIESEESELFSDEDEESGEEDPLEQTPSGYAGGEKLQVCREKAMDNSQ